MPDMNDGEVVWLNKNTGMRFTRVAAAASGSTEKKKKKLMKRASQKAGVETAL